MVAAYIDVHSARIFSAKTTSSNIRRVVSKLTAKTTNVCHVIVMVSSHVCGVKFVSATSTCEERASTRRHAYGRQTAVAEADDEESYVYGSSSYSYAGGNYGEGDDTDDSDEDGDYDGDEETDEEETESSDGTEKAK
uniref:Uncharacterized protein n=1 Tax=Parascaris equorum TaxID=6256 RepID=A0A914RQV1_PAREQ